MSFSFNTHGLTPQDAATGGGSGGDAGGGSNLGLVKGLHLVGVIPVLTAEAGTALTSFEDKGFTVESTVSTSEAHTLDHMFNKDGTNNSSIASFVKDGAMPEITITCDKPYAVQAYMLSGSSNDTYGPKTWTLYGSEDKETWVELDTCTRTSSMPGKSAEFRYLSESTPAYKYYKLKITATNLNFSSFGLHLKDFQLFQRLTF